MHVGVVALAVTALALPVRAQRVVVEQGGTPGAALLDSVLARPHTVRSGTARFTLERNETVSTSLVVIGEPAYLSGHVQGDVVVVGGDLYLHPGVVITGRAAAVGGSVMSTSLGEVAGGTRSYPLETYDIGRATPGLIALRARPMAASPDSAPYFAFGPAMLIPRYDRVDGLSLPLGAKLALRDTMYVVTPSITYRSRLGKWDPGVAVIAHPASMLRLEGRVARDTRTNEEWISHPIVSSLVTFAFGNDTRNWFRSDIAEARAFVPLRRGGLLVEPFVGGRYERVRPVSATGNVYSIMGRDEDDIGRPNPLVDSASIGSALGGVRVATPDGSSVESGVTLQLEKSLSVTGHTSSFLQGVLDGYVEFPTIRTQRLRVRGHAIATSSDSVTKARWSYLGGSGTLPVLETLDLGGPQLVFVESRYFIPITAITLPVVGSPVLTLRHIIGNAWNGDAPPLQQEVGFGIGLSALRLDYMVGAGGTHGHELGVGISFGR